PKTQLQMRTYIGAIVSNLYDVRGGYKPVHDPDSYVESQRLGRSIKVAGGNGVAFDSVRPFTTANIPRFRPKGLPAPPGKPHVRQGPHLILEWDGSRIARYIVMGEQTWKPLPNP